VTRPTWVLLVPADAAWVRAHADPVWEERFGDLDEDEIEPWVIRAGAGDHTALVDSEPGSEGTEEELAERWSAELGRPVYSLRLREDAEAVFRFEGGRLVDAPPDDPEELARRLGIELEELS
jgi:hypothetical protein